MTIRFLAPALALLLAACTGSPDATSADGGHGAGSVTFTHYSDLTEVFAEHRPLVAGRARRFDAHLSWLADYRAVTSGKLTVELIHPDGRIDLGEGSVSDTPGIFRVLVRASEAGEPRLRLTLEANGKTSVHDLGPVTVYPTREAAEAANPEPPPNPQRIAFSKEAQWKIPFGTASAGNSQLAESVPVLVDVRFAPDAEAVVAAPVSGIVQAGPIPSPGQRIAAGQRLATISAQLGQGQDLASLDLDIARARIATDLARSDAKRLGTLHAQEAVPLRRKEEADAALRSAEAELAAAGRRRAALAGGGGGVPVVAPLSGRVLSSALLRGGAVTAGQPLLRIGDSERRWLVVRVPESEAGRVVAPTGLDLLRGSETLGLSVGRDVALVDPGRFIDPASRSMDVIFAGAPEGLRPGTRLPGRLRTGGTVSALAVPASAVIDEGGQTVVYVQVAGETFERRIVATGVRSGDLVGVTGDLKPGERVVTTGAAAVRAAAATPDAFGHGHAH
jgi:RND family efflux transporter MFP subunit